MSIKVSTGLRNAVLASSSLKSALNDGVLRIYAGAEPSTADAAVGGATLLCEIFSDGTAAGINLASTAENGSISKAPGETWSGNHTANGTATWFRHTTLTDDGAASTTAMRIQGSVGVSGADLNLSSVAFTVGTPQNIDYYTLTLPTY